MEIPVINRISDFEGLQNPSFLSQSISLSALHQLTTTFIFWKWGALFLAFVAIFRALVVRIKICIINFRQRNPLASHNLLSDDDFDSDFDETSSISSFESEEEEEDECSSSCSDDCRRMDDSFSFKGSGHYVDDQLRDRKLKLSRRRSIGDCFSWSELFNENSVVKLWDNLGLGLDLNKNPNSISILDMNKEEKLFSLLDYNCFLPAISSSNVIFSAGTEDSKNGRLKIWDTRVDCRVPAIFTDCRWGKAVDIHFNGVNKIYLTDNNSGDVTVSDMRKSKSPLKAETEDTWWDADAVVADSVFQLD